MTPEKVALLEALRLRQLREEFALTPEERFAKAERLLDFAKRCGAPEKPWTDVERARWLVGRRRRLSLGPG